MDTFQILWNLVVLTCIGAALTFLLKTLGKHFMDQNLEIHEMQLNQQLESHKAELELINVKQSKLHAKRIETIVICVITIILQGSTLFDFPKKEFTLDIILVSITVYSIDILRGTEKAVYLVIEEFLKMKNDSK